MRSQSPDLVPAPTPGRGRGWLLPGSWNNREVESLPGGHLKDVPWGGPSLGQGGRGGA